MISTSSGSPGAESIASNAPRNGSCWKDRRAIGYKRARARLVVVRLKVNNKGVSDAFVRSELSPPSIYLVV
jgi:hypothetical protein